jgi:hypothetical protein
VKEQNVRKKEKKEERKKERSFRYGGRYLRRSGSATYLGDGYEGRRALCAVSPISAVSWPPSRGKAKTISYRPIDRRGFGKSVVTF